MTKQNYHEEFYKQAEYYDIAFDFRDIPKECDFLEGECLKHMGCKPSSFLELCAGPTWHTIEFAKRGLKSTALDLSEHMVRYGLDKAAKQGAKINYIQGDMVDFKLSEPVDLVALLMDSATYLLDNDAVYRNFKCVAASLNKGGLYIIEIGHPKHHYEDWNAEHCKWTMERGGKKVTTTWGSQDDPFDPITQITETSVRLEYVDGDNKGEIVTHAPSRCFHANELMALVDASGCFELVTMYGSMSADIPFDNDKKAWRMIPVLRRV
ncbi:MAG: hypothetical protein DRP45_11010 [Candidatus Zixiibacteriota bacterium]|nr:MAG: hypothetical protein DRP45_11010 [candidate division Zixibacteria bacterium]